MSSWAPGALAPRPGAAGAGARWAAQTRTELLLLLRNGEQVLLSLVIPVGLLVVLATLDVVELQRDDVARVDFFTPGVIALAVMSTAFTGQAIATGFERQYGVLKRLGATPLTRSSLLEVKRQDYVRTARAKGLSASRVVNRHMLRNALIPVVTILGPAAAELVTGSIIVETIFGVPGLGREFVGSISARDYPLIMGTTLFYAALVAVANVLVDLAYGLIDPRIHGGG